MPMLIIPLSLTRVERQYDGYRKDASSILSRVTGFITRKGRTRAQFVSNRLEEMRSGLVVRLRLQAGLLYETHTLLLRT